MSSCRARTGPAPSTTSSPLRRGGIKAGATTINIPDTVGYAVPEEYRAHQVAARARAALRQACFSVHCHDDLGMAVANSLAGVRAGARQIECTINGIGERAGNAALEEAVMAMRVRNDVMPYWTQLDDKMLTRASKLVSPLTSFPVQYNKAIVGRNAFAHESGIHQDGMLKHRRPTRSWNRARSVPGPRSCSAS